MAKKPKVRVKAPVVEMDGDEMARVIWRLVKERLLFPRLEMDLQYYDLQVGHRDETSDQVTVDAARALMRHGVGVKCATITPNEDRVREYRLKEAWKSPNATIRGMLDGTVFRKPIIAGNILPVITGWKKPIIIGRHAYGDVYSNREIRVPGAGRAELLFTPEGGAAPVRATIQEFTGPGIIQGMHNTDASIESFARACFTFALDQKVDLWFSTKDTISKTYDTRFRDIFSAEYDTHWRDAFQRAGIEYFFTLIDDAAARIVKSEGGILWALKNYDGDVMSDLVASAYGSLAMMTSVLVSPRGYFEYEAAHGTVQKHYYRHIRGEETSTNSVAIIFAWTGCLRKRAELDATPDVAAFADRLEEATLSVVESGSMTGDLLPVARQDARNRKVGTEEFIDLVASRLNSRI